MLNFGEIKPFPEESYLRINSRLTQDQMIVFTIDLLTEEKLDATFEEIVVASWKLFPSSFSLIGFPEYPDSAKVNRALLHCRPKYRGYVEGEVKKGFRLNQCGADVADNVKKALRESSGIVGTLNRRRSTGVTKSDLFMREVEQSQSYKAFIEGNYSEIDILDIAKILHTEPSLTPELRSNFSKLRKFSEDLNRKDINEFLSYLSSNIKELNGL